MVDVAGIAQRLDGAARTAAAVAQIDHDVSIDDAYAIQAASVARRVERGERRIGMKLGFTSRAKMVQMGVHDLIWGRLTDAMIVEEGGTLDLRRYVHPRVEPEIAFLIGAELGGIVTQAQAQAAIAGVAPALEIIDSRYRDFKFSLTDVVADNASSSGVVLGRWSDPGTDVGNLGMVMSIDGAPVQLGSSAAILGHPLRSLVAAARLAGQAGETLRPGDIVLAGAATPAEPLAPGNHVNLEVQRLGIVSFSIGSS